MVFFKGRNQGSCPEQERDKPIGISLSVCISTAPTLTFKRCLSVQRLLWSSGNVSTPAAPAALPGTEWHVRHLIQVGLWVHGASFRLCGMRFSPTSCLLNAATVLSSISEAVQHLHTAGPELQLQKMGSDVGWRGGRWNALGRKGSCGILPTRQEPGSVAVYSVVL